MTVRLRPDAERALRTVEKKLGLNTSEAVRFVLLEKEHALGSNETDAVEIDAQAIGSR